MSENFNSPMIEEGVMVMKDGKGWGNIYDDGKSYEDGWVHPTRAGMHDPRYCNKPTDVVYRHSPDVLELSTARLVRVRRVTTVEIIEEPTP